MEQKDYTWLVQGLDESREHLRALRVNGEQRRLQLAWAFYRVEAASAAIRGLLQQIAQLQERLPSLPECGEAGAD